MNRIEAALAAPLASVTSAGNAFSKAERSGGYVLSQRPAGKSIFVMGPSPEQTLQKASIRIRALRVRLAAIRAPAAAEHLRVLLLELTDREAAITREVADLVAFLPRYTAVLASLGPATRQLEAALTRGTAYGAAAVSAVYAGKAAALRRFQAKTRDLLVQLHALRPPPVSRPGYVAEVASLRGMGASAGRLAAMLASGAPSNVGPVLTEFDRAAGSGQTVAVQRAEIASAHAYNSTVSALGALSEKVTLERLRLSNTLR